MKPLTKAALEKLLQEDEHAQLEFMSHIHSFPVLLTHIAAFANSAGGRIVIGYQPQSRQFFDCKGLEPAGILRAIQELKPVPMVQCYRLGDQDKELLVVDVESHPDPVTAPDGMVYIRCADQVKAVGTVSQAAPAEAREPREFRPPLGIAATVLLCWMALMQVLAFTMEKEKAIVLAVVSALIAVVFLGILNWYGERSQLQRREAYVRRLRQVTRGQNGESWEAYCDTRSASMDALEFMRVNLENIDEYYTWSQIQAKQAFWLAASMCVLGFVLLAVPMVLLMMGKSLENIQGLAQLSTIGGAISELIAATTFVVYRSSLKQLNYYHMALHEDQRFLSSVSLLDRFGSDEARDALLQKIIETQIQLNLEDQDSRQLQSPEALEPPKQEAQSEVK